ncbi:neutral/alkaline ceramidase [Nocardia huaxiensis]|uniref:neutral/alkaline ceramidase n=1 Tax=Nocardia huaxiensis TaxID=2755382 RepID=UPI001E2F09B4|nr:neutral/alkaline ceramidase [Nocardia huaxiensis]UFS95206.1 neutral/alkaline ceramidase [Nocardia huaxiensis]
MVLSDNGTNTAGGSSAVSRRTVLAGAAAGTAALAVAGTLALPEGEARAENADFLIGVGISDITGPAAECGMMGYSQFGQDTAGIHLRPRARAYVFATGDRRLAYVVADNGMIFQSVHRGVLQELARRFGDRYTEQNVLLTSTHSHATCGGSAHDYAYNLSILGFQQQVYDAEVNGIVEAVVAADADLAPGTLALGRGELHDASVNRSRIAFDRNPEADKQHFPNAIDPAVTVLSLRRGGREIGAVTWFATHNTSMSNKNRLISGDNKGYASFAFEHGEHGVRYLDGADFVASFAQTNSGDMSPNLNLHPTDGPTQDEFENTRIIGERQYRAGKDALAAARPMGGTIDSLLCYIDISDIAVDGRWTDSGQPRRTAPACAGVALIAGSIEDGPGLPGVPIPEGVRNPFVDALGGANQPVPDWLADAQAPKAIVAPLGLMPPAAWVPSVVPLQLVRIGDLYLACGGAEFTIVAGLRIRRVVAEALGVPLENVLMQGYANCYHEYVATPDEYDAQQYEGGSTLYGRYTLPAYQQEFHRLATAFAARQTVPRGPAPRDISNMQPNLVAAPGPDATLPGLSFGDVLTQPAPSYAPGTQAAVEFLSAHPKHSTRRNGTFLEVQRATGNTWTRVANEGEWAVKYFWSRRATDVSAARFTWDIPADATPGRYRFQHFADHLSADGALHPFTGTSAEFDIP